MFRSFRWSTIGTTTTIRGFLYKISDQSTRWSFSFLLLTGRILFSPPPPSLVDAQQLNVTISIALIGTTGHFGFNFYLFGAFSLDEAENEPLLLITLIKFN